jgi:hypothetical protein
MVRSKILLYAAALALVPACHPSSPSRGERKTASTPAYTKPQKTVTIPLAALKNEIVLALDGLHLQLDQTGDPTLEKQEWARRPQCTPPTGAEKAACYQLNCNPPPPHQTIADCHADCDAHQDCIENVCAQRGTTSYVEWGTALTKTCNSPDDSCPPCTPGAMVPLLDTVDTSTMLPSPIYTGDGGPCWLGTVNVDLNRDSEGSSFSEPKTTWTVNLGLDISIATKVRTSSPTLRCSLDVDMTNAQLFLHLRPFVHNHHVVVSSRVDFTADVDYAFEWLYSVHDTVVDAITGDLKGLFSRSQDAINRAFEAAILRYISDADKNQQGQVDDIVDVLMLPDGVAGAGLTITYTPWCANGACGCTPDCNGRSCGLDVHCGTTQCGDGCPAGKMCAADGKTCVCQPNCAGKACGDDGCGGSCGDCNATPLDICYQNQCCTPYCHNRNCGTDFCGGSCGTCSAGQICSASGTCVCQPNCTGKTCGDNGCGGSCGTCGPGTSCQNGQCQCQPNCPFGAACHLNGCGDVCGTCTGRNRTCLLDKGKATCVSNTLQSLPEGGD